MRPYVLGLQDQLTHRNGNELLLGGYDQLVEASLRVILPEFRFGLWALWRTTHVFFFLQGVPSISILSRDPSFSKTSGTRQNGFFENNGQGINA